MKRRSLFAAGTTPKGGAGTSSAMEEKVSSRDELSSSNVDLPHLLTVSEPLSEEEEKEDIFAGKL